MKDLSSVIKTPAQSEPVFLSCFLLRVIPGAVGRSPPVVVFLSRDHGLAVEEHARRSAAVEVDRLGAAVFQQPVRQPAQVRAGILRLRPALEHDRDIVVRFDHPQAGQRLHLLIVAAALDRFLLVDLSLADQPGAEGEHLFRAFFEVFLRRHRVGEVGLHAAVAVYGQRIEAGALPGCFGRLRLGLVPADLPVADDDPRLPGARALQDVLLPGTVEVVRHGEDTGVLFHQQLRAYLVHALRPLALLRRKDRLHRGVFGGPDLRHAVFPHLLLVVFFSHPGDLHGQVPAGVLPYAVLFVLEEVLVPGIIVPGQEPPAVEMPAVLFGRVFFRFRQAQAGDCQHQGEHPRAEALHSVSLHSLFLPVSSRAQSRDLPSCHSERGEDPFRLRI